MSATQDVEISLGTGRLLGLFFALVVVCGIFFGLGYTLGHSMGPTAMAAEAATTTASTTKPAASSSASAETSTAPANDLTFYKTVEQKEANPQLTPAASSAPAAPAPAPARETPHTSTYLVQIAAVSKKEDAEVLAAALRKKNYPVFVASAAAGDALFRVQLGPFSDFKDAEAMRSRLAGDGYTPIVKK